MSFYLFTVYTHTPITFPPLHNLRILFQTLGLVLYLVSGPDGTKHKSYYSARIGLFD